MEFLTLPPWSVGGHCIGVDPYYLAFKAHEVGYVPDMILSGRKINESMVDWVFENLAKALCDAGSKISNSRIVVFGVTFKENCPDTRNSGALKLIDKLVDAGGHVYAIDPLVTENGSKQVGVTSCDFSNLERLGYRRCGFLCEP